MKLIDRAFNNIKTTPPSYVRSGLHYAVVTGSHAYGTDSEDSDTDIVGFCIPPPYVVFPHRLGEIEGFGRQKKRFDQWQEHHIFDSDSGREFDMAVYNIVRFFQLCMENNPNMVDTLFVPDNCVLHMTDIGQKVRENRKLFLHKGSFHKFKGYAYGQRKLMMTKNPEGSRLEMVEQFGYDVKFAMHLVRLLLEVEQILTEGDLDLQRHKDQLKAIRKGAWTLAQVQAFFNEKEAALEKLYNESTVLPYAPREEEIYMLLCDCLDSAYGEKMNRGA